MHPKQPPSFDIKPRINPFKLERYFAKYEFSAPYLLSSSDCEALTLAELLELADTDSLERWQTLKLGYTESTGHPVLRAEIASLYQKISPDNVLVLTPEEGIYIAMNCLLRAHDHVITTFPGYQSLYEVAPSLGCEVSRWTPRHSAGWQFDIDDLEAQIRENTRLIVVNFPHNPTGATLTAAELDRLVDLARQHNILLFSDEMYRLLEYDPATRPPSLCDSYENAIALSGMSKSFALAGLRIGWLTTQNPDLLRAFALYKDYTTICSSGPSEILALMGLRAKAHILRRNLQLIHDNLAILDTFFADYADLFRWHRPQAGPIGFAKFLGAEKIDILCQNLVEKKGVMLLPASQYDYKGNFFRLGFARRNMPEALARLTEYINEVYH